MIGDKTYLAISMITYNHEEFIGQAIESILMQQTDFKYKLFITNDCSTDATASICNKYANDYPDLIDFEDFSENKGIIKNWTYNLKKCKDQKVKYIATCEGDDYWTDRLKLQKQVDYLDKNLDVNWLHTDFDWLDENTNTIIKNYYKSINYNFPPIYDVRYFFLNAKSRTLTACFRSKEIIGFDILMSRNNWSVGDTALLLFVVKNKKIGFINESTGVYRRGLNTASSKVNPKKQFDYWQNASHKVKMFFYDHYQINDKKIKKYLIDEYYDNMFDLAIPAWKAKYIIKSFFYKIFNLRLSKSNIGHFVYTLLRIKK